MNLGTSRFNQSFGLDDRCFGIAFLFLFFQVWRLYERFPAMIDGPYVHILFASIVFFQAGQFSPFCDISPPHVNITEIVMPRGGNKRYFLPDAFHAFKPIIFIFDWTNPGRVVTRAPFYQSSDLIKISGGWYTLNFNTSASLYFSTWMTRIFFCSDFRKIGAGFPPTINTRWL